MIPKLRFQEFRGAYSYNTFKDYVVINQGLQIAISDRLNSPINGAYFYITNEFLRSNSIKSYWVNDPPKNSICSFEDILMTRTGNTGIVVTDVQGVFHNNFFKIKYPSDLFNKVWLVEYLRRYAIQKQILRYAGTSTIPDLNHKDFYRLPLIHPSIEEQKKIATLLSILNSKINLLTKKKEALKTYKKGLMQKIFSQELRFKREDGTDYPEWESLSFSAVFDRVKRKNKNGLETVLTISAQLGLVDPTEYFSRDVSSSDKSNYTLLHRNEFAYNKSYSKGYPLGAIKRNTRYNVGVLSPLYICFACKNKAFVEYYEHYFESGIFNKQIYRIAQEGARNHGLLNVSVTEFFEDTILKHPSKEESQKISDILTKFDAFITSVSEKLGAAEQLKKGLLQQMFV